MDGGVVVVVTPFVQVLLAPSPPEVVAVWCQCGFITSSPLSFDIRADTSSANVCETMELQSSDFSTSIQISINYRHRIMFKH